MENFFDPADCSIERNLPGYEKQAVLMSCDGDYLLVVPSTWTDDQILTALCFANYTHRIGFNKGMIQKAYEIRKALGV